MILILAEPADPWATLVHRELLRRGEEELFWIQPAQLLDRVLLNWSVGTWLPLLPSSLVVDGNPIPLADLKGIFPCLMFPPPIELKDLSSQDRDYILKETTAAWFAILNALPCAVVNRPIPGGRPTLLTGSPLLSERAREQGFMLPPSRCTSSRADAILQYSAWSERAYLKPLGSHEPGRFLYAQDGMEQIHRIMERQAVSMQSIPEGQRLTVFVVGDDAVATVVHAGDRSELSSDVPAFPTHDCLGLVREMGLTFAECQFIVTPEGQTYCLDVSSAPSIWHCPQEVQQRIVFRLVEYLSEMRSLSRHDSLDGPDGRSSTCERLCETRSSQR
ncbi:MAG: hypothetical protein EHM80_05040 [Nitrospiraceae bacterium]|nr:MAG: hypothetical protein EHM80_05040 [Nitrospiraceae bacterium]